MNDRDGRGSGRRINPMRPAAAPAGFNPPGDLIGYLHNVFENDHHRTLVVAVTTLTAGN